MLKFDVDTVLLDIEGTVSPIAYVYEVLFPFARDNMETFLRQSWTDVHTRAACRQLALDSGAADLADQDALLDDFLKGENIERLVGEAFRLMDADVKATGLKELQGLIWKHGYEIGQLQSQIFPDVEPALKRWTEQNATIVIYSSGSVTAQRVFFAHTEYGDLTKYISGYYDTTSGAKKDAASYKAIADKLKKPPEAILFISDVTAELKAAQASGLPSLLCVRPGNKPDESDSAITSIKSFDQIQLTAAVEH